MKRIMLCFTLFFFIGSFAFADTAPKIKTGVPLPEVTVKGDELGELELKKDDVIFKKWNSKSLKGKVRTVYHLAARMGIDDINKAYVDALEANDFPSSSYQTVTILNLGDALWGTGGFARSEFSKNKKKYPDSGFVLDDENTVRDKWGLKEEGSAIILIDKDGNVLAHKDGKLTPAEVNQFMQMIKDRL